MVCRNGHELSAAASANCGMCDNCEGAFAASEDVWSCQACNYDLCQTCAREAAAATGHLNMAVFAAQIGRPRALRAFLRFDPTLVVAVPGLLAVSAFSGNRKCVAVLLDARMDPDSKTRHGQSAIYSAAASGSAAAARLLIAAGADVNVPHGDPHLPQRRPIHATAFSGDAVLARLLIKARADINAIDGYNDDHALHLCAMHGAGVWLGCCWPLAHSGTCRIETVCFHSARPH